MFVPWNRHLTVDTLEYGTIYAKSRIRTVKPFFEEKMSQMNLDLKTKKSQEVSYRRTRRDLPKS